MTPTEVQLHQHETEVDGQEIIIHYRWHNGAVKFEAVTDMRDNMVSLDINQQKRIKREEIKTEAL